MKSIIIGAGEIGKSLHNVLKNAHEVYLRDVEEVDIPTDIEVMNICYPYHKNFIKTTKEYIKQYSPKVVIVHSTVPVGTSEKLDAVHSPCHGKHPNLQKGILTFVKYVGGEDPEKVYIAKEYLTQAGIEAQMVASSRTSELSKIMCTSYYGWNIVFMKEMQKICKKHGVPFHEVYTDWNHLYDIGYADLNMPQFIIPVLDPMPGKIGGHCVVNNTDLESNYIANIIKEKIAEY